MIVKIDTIDIGKILLELTQIKSDAWEILTEFTNPINQDVLGSQIFKNNLSTTRHQRRLHLIWQTSIDHNEPWFRDSNWRTFPIDHAEHAVNFPKTISILTDYWNHRNYFLKRLFFSKLSPGQEIYAHADTPWCDDYAQVERHTLVVTTNPNCQTFSNDVSDNPAPGTLFWFDHNQLHGSANQGNTDRIYLIMDVKSRLT